LINFHVQPSQGKQKGNLTKLVVGSNLLICTDLAEEFDYKKSLASWMDLLYLALTINLKGRDKPTTHTLAVTSVVLLMLKKTTNKHATAQHWEPNKIN